MSQASHERAATSLADASSQDARRARVVPLHRETGYGFGMLRKDSENWFPICIEVDQPPSLRTRNSRRSRYSSANDVQHSPGRGHSRSDRTEYGLSACSGGRRKSQSKSQKPFENDHNDFKAATEGKEGFDQEYNRCRPRRQEWFVSWKHSSAPGGAKLKCYHCGTKETPQWRRGPGALLCNFCGLLWDRRCRKRTKRSCSYREREEEGSVGSVMRF